MTAALAGVRVCDLTGQLAGAGATRTLAAFGAEVIRIEDPVRQGQWDILRGKFPFVDERRGIELGGAFNNHNVGKLGITLNTRTERGRELLAELIRASDVVAENFSADVLASWGFGWDRIRELRPDVVYVSNSGFGKTGPYRTFRTWGPIVQAVCGLTFTSRLAGQPSAGWGYSYMDHHGANLMALAILAALHHRSRTGEGQWVDMSCVEAGAALLGPCVLDWSVNGRGQRDGDGPDSNHSAVPPMAPHAVYPAAGTDAWVAVACRDDADWRALAAVIGEPWCAEERWERVGGRLAHEAELDAHVGRWTSARDRHDVERQLLAAGVPAAAVASPPERCDHDASNDRFGLWPWVTHPDIGRVRVDGIPAHLSATDWHIERGAPRLGEHNRHVYGDLLGLAPTEIDALEADGVI